MFSPSPLFIACLSCPTVFRDFQCTVQVDEWEHSSHGVHGTQCASLWALWSWLPAVLIGMSWGKMPGYRRTREGLHDTLCVIHRSEDYSTTVLIVLGKDARVQDSRRTPSCSPSALHEAAARTDRKRRVWQEKLVCCLWLAPCLLAWTPASTLDCVGGTFDMARLVCCLCLVPSQTSCSNQET